LRSRRGRSDIGETLELLGVPGSVLEGPQLVAIQLALAAARLSAPSWAG